MTQAKRSARRWRTIATITVAGLLTVCGVVLSPIAVGQEPALITKLKNNVKCSERDAAKQLNRNAARSGADLPDVLAALDELSIDRKACAEIKDAASVLARDLAKAEPAPTKAAPQAEVEAEPATDARPDVIALAAAERMREVLAEADQSASAMRFEVGPPPRNLTRNRAAPT